MSIKDLFLIHYTEKIQLDDLTFDISFFLPFIRENLPPHIGMPGSTAKQNCVPLILIMNWFYWKVIFFWKSISNESIFFGYHLLLYYFSFILTKT